MRVLESTAQGVQTSARYLGKGAQKVFTTAVQHPFVTLGVLAAAAGTGYYFYNKNRDEQAEAVKSSTAASLPLSGAAPAKSPEAKVEVPAAAKE